MADSVWILRHGETEWSATGRHTSHTDLPLTETGREQARAAAAKLAGIGFSLVLCSPLLRARETCRLAGFAEASELCDALREWDYGDYEGLTTPEIRERDPGWSVWTGGCPGGESPAQIGARIDGLIARLDDVDGDVLCIAHGHSLRVLGARWCDFPVAAGQRLALVTAGVGELGREHELPVITRWSI